MDLKETSNKLSKIKLDEETKEGILGLMDDKINNDMEKLIGVIDKLETSIDKLDHKLDVSVGSLRSEMNASIGSLKEGNSNLKWVVGISSGAIGVLITILGLLFALKK